MTTAPDFSVAIRRDDPAAVVEVNGVGVGSTPQPLLHGDKVTIGAIDLLFVDERKSGSTQYVSAVKLQDLQPSSKGPGKATGSTGGRLVSLVDGREYQITTASVRIGRDAGADIVASSGQVSRRHCEILVSPRGYILVDSSTNGTFVNGERIQNQKLLARADIIKVGDEEFRFYADLVAPPAPPAPAPAPPPVAAAPVAAAPPAPPAVPFAPPPVVAAPVAPPPAVAAPAPAPAPPPVTAAPAPVPQAPPPAAPPAPAETVPAPYSPAQLVSTGYFATPSGGSHAPGTPVPPPAAKAPPAAVVPPPPPAAPPPVAQAPPARPAPVAAAQPPVSEAPAKAPSTVLAKFLVRSGAQKGLRLMVKVPIVNIGRADYNDLVLADDSVSSQHAKLTRREGVWILNDLGSTNGTMVDGERISEDMPIAPGAFVRFGDVQLIFEPTDDDVEMKQGGSTRMISAVDLGKLRPPSGQR